MNCSKCGKPVRFPFQETCWGCQREARLAEGRLSARETRQTQERAALRAIVWTPGPASRRW
jgi:hypothetical protein